MSTGRSTRDASPAAADVDGLSVEEIQEVFGVSRDAARRARVRALRAARRPTAEPVPPRGAPARGARPPAPAPPAPRAPAPQAPTVAEHHPDAVDGLMLLVGARRAHAPPEPAALAGAVRAIGRAPRELLDAAWREAGAEQPPTQPRRRAAWLAARGPGQAVDDWMELHELWTEAQSWHSSAASYASAVALWGEAARVSGEPAWPPGEATLRRYSWCIPCPATLTKYLMRLRSVLALVRSELGVLADTRRLERGATATGRGTQGRPKIRATAQQTRDLCSALRGRLGAPDVADAFVVARHFCLRFGAEVAPLSYTGAHSSIQIHPARHGRPPRAEITFFRRKMCNTPVVVARSCICGEAANALCGVCILSSRPSRGRVFPTVNYDTALALLKRAAAAAGLPSPSHWGTHCFRRGAADDALRAGGPSALFWCGGWRGVAAFGYASARTLGETNAANYLVEYSDSSGDDEAAPARQD